MDPKLHRLLDRVEELFLERGQLERAYRSGASHVLPLPRLFHGYRDLTHPDTFFELRERFEGAPAGSSERASLGALGVCLAELAADARASEALGTLAEWEVTFAPRRDDPGVAVLEALRQLPRDPAHARRQLFARAVDRELEAQDRLYSAAINARFETAERLGFDGPLALRASLGAASPESFVADCERFLAITEDPYRDLLSYTLRRAEPSLRNAPVGADLVDLQRAALAPWTFGELTRGQVTHATRRWIEDWQVATHAGRIEVDDEDRPGKPVLATVTPVRVPQSVFVTVRLEAGVADTAELLRGQGEALAWALRDPRESVAQRRLGAREWPQAMATLFARVAADAGWLERYLRLGRTGAREVARLFAFAELVRLRTACAQLAFERWLLANGLGRDVRDAYEGELARALRVSIPRGAALRSAQQPLAVETVLHGAARGGTLPALLRDRFDEDYWRNPGAAAVLRELVARPALQTEALARLGGAPEAPLLTATAAELIQTMGA